MTKRRPLTEEEFAAIRAYARENGHYLKARLRDDWMNARTTGILQALRNSHGPSWLVSYSLPSPQPPAGLEQAISVTSDNGDIYEAIKAGANEPWTISYPEGGDRFHGTEAELRAHIKRLISAGSPAKTAP